MPNVSANCGDEVYGHEIGDDKIGGDNDCHTAQPCSRYPSPVEMKSTRSTIMSMRTAAILWRSTHPGPTLVVTALSFGLALALAPGLSPARFALLVVAVFLGQVSIGVSNDAIDAPRDRINERADKPLAMPGAPLAAAWIVAYSAAALALAMSALLSWQMAVAHLIFVGSGWVYNAWAKSTVWSAACFVVGFGIFPSLPPLTESSPAFAPAWASVAGAAFGVAIHFSNVLPDLEGDARTGVRGLPHRLGRRWSAFVASASLITGAAVAAKATPAIGDSWLVTLLPWIGFALVGGVAVWALYVAISRRPSRLPFQLVMFAALLLALQVIVTGGLTD